MDRDQPIGDDHDPHPAAPPADPSAHGSGRGWQTAPAADDDVLLEDDVG